MSGLSDPAMACRDINCPIQRAPHTHEPDPRDARIAELEAALEGRTVSCVCGGERVAQMIAHRACCGSEHDPSVGRIHGYCVVCGVPWPCEYAGPLPTPSDAGKETRESAVSWSQK